MWKLSLNPTISLWQVIAFDERNVFDKWDISNQQRIVFVVIAVQLIIDELHLRPNVSRLRLIWYWRVYDSQRACSTTQCKFLALKQALSILI